MTLAPVIQVRSTFSNPLVIIHITKVPNQLIIIPVPLPNKHYVVVQTLAVVRRLKIQIFLILDCIVIRFITFKLNKTNRN